VSKADLIEVEYVESYKEVPESYFLKNKSSVKFKPIK